jgi:hypothetical protein
MRASLKKARNNKVYVIERAQQERVRRMTEKVRMQRLKTRSPASARLGENPHGDGQMVSQCFLALNQYSSAFSGCNGKIRPGKRRLRLRSPRKAASGALA